MSAKKITGKEIKDDSVKARKKSTSAEISSPGKQKVITKPKTQPKKEEIKIKGIDDSLLIQGISLIEQNKLEAALECFEDFTKKYPENHYGWYYIGYTKMLQDKKKDAAKNFSKASKLNEKFLPSFYYMGLLEFENNDWQKALGIFDGIMDKFTTDEIKESNFNIPYFIAICYHYLGNLERAEEYFMFAFNMSPEDPVVLYYKGFNELAMKDYDFAVETFKNLLYVDINNQNFWDLLKGYSYYYHQHEDKNE